uniref:Succinate dehydrogenase assembly factor 2, mitochondrial n=1 Tax=Syphacia muris TaxID=451379 RepID=A0A0N5AQ92_9BILA
LSSSYFTVKTSDTKTLRARLLYQSKKRGILENDILIGDFADEFLGSMSHDELVDYDKLINGEHMEWDLYYYMSGKKQPPQDVADSKAFHKLREYVVSKASQGGK